MTALQLNSELFLALSKIGDDKNLMQKVVDFVKDLVSKKEDDTLMTKEEFYATIEQAEEDYRQGRCARLQEGESVTDLLKRCGYDI